MTLAAIDLDTIDPGVRRLVRWLRAMGFDTTDSGDGVTKPAAGDVEALTVPHVFIRGNIPCVLQRRLAIAGIEPAVGRIQYTYDPADNSHVVALYASDAEVFGDRAVCEKCGGSGHKDLTSLCATCVGVGMTTNKGEAKA